MTGFGSFLRQLWRDMSSQKLRTFMTTFGIVWGTVAVALLLAVGEGIHRQQLKSFTGLGDHIVIAFPGRTSMVYEGLGKGRAIQVDEDDMDYLRAQIPELAGLSSEYMKTLQLRRGEMVRNVAVSGVSPIFGKLRSMVPETGGRFIDPVDMSQRRRVGFIGDKLAKDIFEDEDPVGQEVILNGSPFTIVGVMKHKPQDSSYSGRDTSKLMIPSSTFIALTGQLHPNLFIYRAKKTDGSAQASGAVIDALAKRKRFDPADRGAIELWDTTEMFVFLDNFMLAFQLFMGLMGVLTLVVGGIGVSNIMNVVVEERSREIGIKMALGAKPRAILGQFMVETLVLTAVGGAIGIALALALCAVVPAAGLNEFLGEPVLSPSLALLTVSVLGTVGFLAGYFPARDAARLDPVVAMKL